VGQIYLGCYAIWDDESRDAVNKTSLRQSNDSFSSTTTGH
jgi:hypothetical protein